MFEQKNLPRTEIKQDFSKAPENLTRKELNDIANNFRRFKAIQLEEIRKSNPGFGLKAQAHKFDGEATLNLMELIISKKDDEKNILDQNYGEAAVIIDWYSARQKEQEKKQAQEELKTKEAEAR